MVTISYDALDDLVHAVADEIEKETGIPAGQLNLIDLNTTLVGYLDGYGVLYEDELDFEANPE